MTHGGTETEYQLQTWQLQNFLEELVLKERKWLIISVRGALQIPNQKPYLHEKPGSIHASHSLPQLTHPLSYPNQWWHQNVLGRANHVFPFYDTCSLA